MDYSVRYILISDSDQNEKLIIPIQYIGSISINDLWLFDLNNFIRLA